MGLWVAVCGQLQESNQTKTRMQYKSFNPSNLQFRDSYVYPATLVQFRLKLLPLAVGNAMNEFHTATPFQIGKANLRIEQAHGGPSFRTYKLPDACPTSPLCLSLLANTLQHGFNLKAPPPHVTFPANLRSWKANLHQKVLFSHPFLQASISALSMPDMFFFPLRLTKTLGSGGASEGSETVLLPSCK
eukprot:1155891-Pelagomonas_calceolata.AAC.6